MSRADYPGFVILPRFDAAWHRLGLDDADLAALQQALAANPAAGDVVAGTGGIRKFRYRRHGRGKSGGVRVLYANFPTHCVLLLADVYGKSHRAGPSAAEKAYLAGAVAIFAARLPPTD